MARDLYDCFAEVRETYAEAKEILGFDLAKVSFEGPEEELKQTRITQPAIFVHSVVLTQRLKRIGITPALTAGHSLGEYSALHAAGALSFSDALNLVKIRAELMQRAGEINEGAMAAVIGLQREAVEQACVSAADVGIVQIANFNSLTQLVISGSVAGVNQAMDLVRAKGAKRVVPLTVSGAFHSPLMAYASEGLSEALDSVTIRTASVPTYTNVNPKPVTDEAEIRSLLLQQLTSPVRWLEIIENMIAAGTTDFYEVGPGSVLIGLLRRISRDVKGWAVNSMESLERYQRE